MNPAAAFKRCLPALQQLARFPTADRAYVCRKRSLDQNDVDATQRAVLLELGRSVWNEDALQLAAVKYGVKLLPLDFKLTPPPPEPVAETVRRVQEAHKGIVVTMGTPARAQVDKGTDAPTRPPAPPLKLEPATRIQRLNSRAVDHLAVCRLMLETPGLSQTKAAEICGLKSGSWAYFKKKHFGLGPIDRAQLCKVLGSDGAVASSRPPAGKVYTQSSTAATKAAPPPPADMAGDDSPTRPAAMPLTMLVIDLDLVKEIFGNIAGEFARLAKALKGFQ